MSDQKGDALLRRLGREARSREDLSREPVTEGPSDSPGDEPSWDNDSSWETEASRPLDGAAQARIVERLEKLLEDEAGQEAAHDPDSVRDPAREKTIVEADRSRPRNARPATRRRRQLRIALPIAACLLIAVALFQVLPQTSDVALPPYGVMVDGAIQAQRGTGADLEPIVHRVAPGNRLQIVLTPAAPVDEPFSVRAFLDRGADWLELPSDLIERSGQGAVRIDARIGSELTLAPGRRRLLIVLASPHRGRSLQLSELAEMAEMAETEQTDEPAGESTTPTNESTDSANPQTYLVQLEMVSAQATDGDP